MHRTVLYRYFDDRTDLDLAIQREICLRAGEVLLSAVTLEGTPREIVQRIVAAYVGWSVENTALMRYAERDVPGANAKPLDEAISQIAEQIESRHRRVHRRPRHRDQRGRPRLADSVGVPARRRRHRRRPQPGCHATRCGPPPPSSPTCSPRSPGSRSRPWQRPATSRCPTSPSSRLLNPKEAP
ncbi:hypothetical protein G5V59_20230 [Nocardioides sp. W3-2-3]|uniref:hypothetical protein n=1 Tax=Nocardioides convexus TaxID=2712224 RepID=UPI002418382C|nr:hypothetical protein [Nocardioides convexus]NHA01386.1 hypothetical protein [Nocardioides convexus]